MPLTTLLRRAIGLVLMLSASLALASSRDFEVFRDELPDSLPPDQLEIVVLSEPDSCVPRLEKRFGLTFDVSGATPQQRMVCRDVLPALMGTTADGVRLRHVQLARADGRVADDVARAMAAAAAGEPGDAAPRRYVALLRWSVWPLNNYLGMAFEEVLFDRESRRWLWHATRRDQSWMFSREGVKEHQKEATDVLRALLHQDLPHAMARRGSHRQGDLPAGARWVPPAEVDGWSPGQQAGLVLVNQDHRESTHATAPFDKLVLRRADEPDRSKTVLVPGSWRHRQHAQASPPIQQFTYAVLALPPGDYLASYGTKEPFPLKLNAGDVLVYTTLVQLLRMGDTRTERTLDWFRQTKPRLRHAFLADPVASGGGEVDRVHYRAPM